MKSAPFKTITLAVLAALLSACGGGGGGSGSDIRPDYNGGGNGNNHAGNGNRPISGTWQAAAANDKAEALSGDGAYIGIVDTGIKTDGIGLRNRNARISKKVIAVYDNELVDSNDTIGHGTKMTEII